MLAATTRRGRFLPEGRYQETVSVLVTASVYGLAVATLTRGLGPEGAVSATWVWTGFVLALLSAAGGTLRKGSAWLDWWGSTVPGWIRCGVRGSGVGAGVLIAGGGMALAVGLVAHFGTAVGVAAIAAPSWMDGLGMAVLGMAYVPNAVIAGVGYISGVGFEIGPGTYSPFGAATVDLPAVPLLAAAPDQSGPSWVGIAFLAVPLLAGFLLARPAIRNLATRYERVQAAATGALCTGAALAAASAIARGGAGGGRWSTIGAPPLLVGAVIVVETGVVAVASAVLTGAKTVPWRLDQAKPARAAARASAPDTGSDDGARAAQEAAVEESVTDNSVADSVADDSDLPDPEVDVAELADSDDDPPDVDPPDVDPPDADEASDKEASDDAAHGDQSHEDEAGNVKAETQDDEA
jgi:hypothetical protein